MNDEEAVKARTMLAYTLGIVIGAWLMYRFLMSRGVLTFVCVEPAPETEPARALPFRSPRVKRRERPELPELPDVLGQAETAATGQADPVANALEGTGNVTEGES